jgi:RNA polymerase sigma factor (sigma-70 family)
VSQRLRGGWTEAWVEDVVQESLLDVFRGLRECRAHSEGELRAWARTIAHRQVASLIRREAPRLEVVVPLATLPGIADTGHQEPSPRLRALLAVLAAAVDDLPPAQSYLLWAHVQTDATWRETGAELGIAATAAKRRYQRLIASLRRRCARVHA